MGITESQKWPPSGEIYEGIVLPAYAWQLVHHIIEIVCRIRRWAELPETKKKSMLSVAFALILCCYVSADQSNFSSTAIREYCRRLSMSSLPARVPFVSISRSLAHSPGAPLLVVLKCLQTPAQTVFIDFEDISHFLGYGEVATIIFKDFNLLLRQNVNLIQQEECYLNRKRALPPFRRHSDLFRATGRHSSRQQRTAAPLAAQVFCVRKSDSVF